MNFDLSNHHTKFCINKELKRIDHNEFINNEQLKENLSSRVYKRILKEFII